MSADERLDRLIDPERTSSNPKANYRNATRWGDLVFVSGKSAGAAIDGKPSKGRLGDTLTLEDGVSFAREAALELLLVLRDELGSLERVKQVLDVQGFVNADAAFEDHAKVLDGASDLLVEVLGDAGVHARSVFGAVSLRGGQPVILRAVVGVSDS
ncbi:MULTISPECIES: RidA family protein [Caballeronia]|uniref:Endoribonuclease L-PSP n=1 Tax=Caballeronia zhejiangensis TaxID=871203 RepID=A0A656QWB6_9BURK|nr:MULTISPECIES: RidA family protein [Caballeronia]EKS71056.1 endoribonuclease L-PSP [Burkholderia sp. SJ98]KDR34078.1 endoribonuclease L-PSP [Caballeronia zhejiangensis]MCG7404609.1 RidA family protein [Caballeronia zhejiangensis]MDR5788282.1 RidA family protein [Caballeronia sp. LP003]MDR5795060.1 RidA family protein [Caballeronia sp. LZ008]